MRIGASLLVLLLLPASSGAGGKAIAPVLTLEHQHPAGAFTFRTPEGWQVQPISGEALEAWGGELGLRFLFRQGESGYDSLHAVCILEGLAPAASTDLHFRYEYEFVGGLLANRRVLDTAHSVRYEAPVRGHRDWRQRTLTVVGGGQSLCVMSYAPTAVWKKKAEARAVLDAVLGSLTFRQ